MYIIVILTIQIHVPRTSDLTTRSSCLTMLINDNICIVIIINSHILLLSFTNNVLILIVVDTTIIVIYCHLL